MTANTITGCAAEEEDLAPKNEKKCQTLTVFWSIRKICEGNRRQRSVTSDSGMTTEMS